jgi:hypothetical protein
MIHLSLARRVGKLRLLFRNPSIRAAKAAIKHIRAVLRNHGARSLIARTGLFEEKWYKDNYPDVAAAGVDPIRHYLGFGAHEGRDPSPYFSTWEYLALNPEVAAAGTNPLLHHIRALRNGGAAMKPNKDVLDRRTTLRGSSVGRLTNLLSVRANDEQVVIFGSNVSVWQKNPPMI